MEVPTRIVKQVYMCVCVCVCVYVYMCVYVCMYVCVCVCFEVFLLTSVLCVVFFIITDNHLTLNRMKSGSQSAKSHILRDMMTTFKKHYNQNQKSFITSMFTHTRRNLS